MSKKLKIRTLKVQKLPYGKYTWKVLFHAPARGRYSRCNSKEIQPILDLLENTGTGKIRVFYHENWRKQRIYDSVLLTNKADVALIKMCHGEQLFKIYHMVVEAAETSQPPSET